MNGVEYLVAHGVDLDLAARLDVRPAAASVSYSYTRPDGTTYARVRHLAGKLAGKTMQPKGEPLALYWPADRRGEAVLLCEGEIDAISALSAIRSADPVPAALDGLIVAAVPGASMPADRAAAELRDAGAEVVYIAFDGDRAGRDATQRIAAELTEVGSSAVIVALPDGSDISDELVSVERPSARLTELLTQCSASFEADTDDAANRDEGEEPAVEIRPPEVIGELLEDVLRFLDRYVVLPGDDARFALALWVAHTHAFEGAHATPYPLVLSAEKRSGKTRAQEGLSLLVARPWPVIGASEAAIFRKIDRDRPTLLLDEIDALWASSSERTEPLRAILNAGNRPGAAVARCTGEGGANVEDFSVYCPKAGFGIDNGRIPDTLIDRSIVIRMVRRTSAEPVERFRYRIADAEAAPIREALAGWGAGAAVDLLLEADPDIPLDLDDRAAEAWEPLIAIADLAGGPWPQRARAAAKALSANGDREEVTTGSMLLRAIRDAFGDRDRIATAELLARINADDELPFGAWRDGKGLDGRRLAKLLRPYSVRPRSIRIGEEVAKGYLREQFEEPWQRWTPPSEKSVTAVTGLQGGDGVTPDSASQAGCNAVTHVTAKSEGGEGVTATAEEEAEVERLAARHLDLAEAVTP